MRFAFLALFALLLCTPFSFAQDYGLEEEVVNENIGVLIGALGVVDLTGYSCTRYYVTMNNEDDFMSKAAITPRSNCVMDTTKSENHGIALRPVEEAVRDSLSKMRMHVSL